MRSAPHFLLVVLGVVTSVLVVAHAQGSGESRGRVYLKEGRYRQVLVAVDQAVDYSEEVLSHLKEYIRRTSEAMYIATSPVSARSFGDVTILLPRSWPPISQCKSVSTENQNEANFIVEKDTTMWGSNPHTQKIDSQCGNPGKVTYLPRSFVADLDEAKKYGPNIGKTILHEWGHLRYGLFDELEEVNNPTTCVMFDGVTKPVKCSTDVQGILEQDSDKCNFQAYLNQPEDVKASIMYLQYLDSVETFCNKTGAGITHNRDAQNPQNDRCDGRSAWEVMMEHPDFKLHKESATGNDVAIQCVQDIDLDRMVLVMDVSGSMQEDHRLLRMQQDVRLFLQSLPCRDTSIGMVEFSGNMTQAKITHPLARLDSDINIDTLTGAIPQGTLDRTCIGCGIRRAIQLVESSGRTVNGTVLAIFTDGLENEHPFIEEVESEVLSRGMVVYSIMLMSQARDHPLIKLSSETGGRSCTFADNQHTTYYDCLNGILHHRSPLTAPNQMLSTLITAAIRQSVSGTVVIDARPGDDVVFTVTWSSEYLGGCEDTLVVITSPSGTTITKDNIENYSYNYKLRTATIEVVVDESNYTAGTWTYLIDNKDYHSNCVCRVRVEARRYIDDCSQGIYDHDVPILIYSTVDTQRLILDKDKDPLDNAVKLYVEVFQGGNVIINATVVAEIESDTGKKWNITLLDNGIATNQYQSPSFPYVNTGFNITIPQCPARLFSLPLGIRPIDRRIACTGADLKANDGTYSRYFTDFDDDGTYSVKFNVVGDENTKIQIGSTTIRQMAAPIMPNYTYNVVDEYHPLDPFMRTKVGGIFEVVNYDVVANGTSEVKELLFPPQKITSLSLKFDREISIITLEWTAVGEALDKGTASFYDIRWSTSADDLRNHFNTSHMITDANIVEGSISQAQDVGEDELLKLLASSMNLEEQEIYYFAVKTVNSYNLVSPVSNVVLFQFLHPRSPTSTILHVNPSTTITTSSTVKDSTSKSSNPAEFTTEKGSSLVKSTIDDRTVYSSSTLSILLSSSTAAEAMDAPKTAFPTWVYYVIAGLGGAFLLAVLVSCMVCCSRPSRGKQKGQKGDEFMGQTGMTVTPDGVSLEIIEPSGGGSDQEPDLIKEINEKDLAAKPSAQKHSTWPATKYGKNKREKQKKRGNIFRSIGKSHFVSEIRKRLSHTKSSTEKLEKQWSTPCEPLQDHAYSNPLFGHAVLVPEIQIHNTVIQQHVALPNPNGDGTSSLYERKTHNTGTQQHNQHLPQATIADGTTASIYESRLSLQ